MQKNITVAIAILAIASMIVVPALETAALARSDSHTNPYGHKHQTHHPSRKHHSVHCTNDNVNHNNPTFGIAGPLVSWNDINSNVYHNIAVDPFSAQYYTQISC